MHRRNFIQKSLTLGSGLLTFPLIQKALNAARSGFAQSRVIRAVDQKLHDKNNRIVTERLQNLLDRAVQAYYKSTQASDAWERIASPGETIGLKVNCLAGYAATHTELVDAICERLMQIGIKPKNIIIWDRLSSDLEDGGYTINKTNTGIRCIGNDIYGFRPELEVFGKAGSMVCKTLSEHCDGIINLPLLKDHSIAGITAALKNMFGAIHNPHKYHLDGGDPYIADVNMLPSIRNKVRLTVCDALEAQYEGGPSFIPQWRWDFNGLLVAQDPVALDYTVWQIIERKRAENNMKSLKKKGRKPTYIATAADSKHRLGTDNPNRIKLINV